MTKDVIMFCDTGIDDAVAIIMALSDKKINLKAVVASKGNVSQKQVAKNTIEVLEYVKKDIPVFVGNKKKFGKTKFKLKSVHGKDGLGEYPFMKPKKKARSFKEFLTYFNSLQKKVSIICTGPLTDLAILSEKVNLSEKVENIYLQNGELSDPNYTSFNVAEDPKAVEKVLSLGLPIIICPSDMGHTAFLNKTDVEKIRKLNKTGEMLEFIFRSHHDRVVKNNVAAHDACLIYSFSNPEKFEWKYANLQVDYVNQIGILHFDFCKKKTNRKISTQIDIKSFKKYLFDCVKNIEMVD